MIPPISTRSRLVPALVLILGVAAVCAAQWTLARAVDDAHSRALPETIRAAQERFLRSFAVLHAARDQLPLTEDQRDEIARSDPHQTGFIGLELTPTTTTDGSLQAKRLSTHPRWVRDIAAMLEALHPGDVVWIGASGSFPALTVAAILACEARGLTPLVISSLTASTYGANLPDFDVLTMERLLHHSGIIAHTSIAASVGGEQDRGIGLDPTAVADLRVTILDHAIPLIDPVDLPDSIQARLHHWREATAADRPAAFINIGGNPANIGPAHEAARLQPGLNPPVHDDDARPVGVALQLLHHRVPVIHLLNIAQIPPHTPPATHTTHTTPLNLARRALALLAILLAASWTAARLTPPATGPLTVTPTTQGAPQP